MKKIGISSYYLQNLFGPTRALEILAASGFDSVDFDLGEYGVGKDEIYKSDEAMLEHFTRIKERADELGLIISQTHGRCCTYTPEKKQCDFAKWVSERDLFATSILGAPACVIHNISTGQWGVRDPEFMHEKNAEFISDISPFAEKHGVCIGFETFGDVWLDGKRHLDFFGDSYELKKQFDITKTKNKVLCMDTGHTNKACSVWKEKGLDLPHVEESVKLFGKDLKLLHLNDNNGYTDQHLPPYFSGYQFSLNWDSIMETLDSVGYDGVYNFELNLDFLKPVILDIFPVLGKYLREFINKYE